MDRKTIDEGLDAAQAVLQLVEDAAPKLAAIGIPYAVLAGVIADGLGKLAERGHSTNEALHTADRERLAKLLAEARAFADAQEREALD